MFLTIALAPLVTVTVYVFWIEPEIKKVKPFTKPGFNYQQFSTPWVSRGVSTPAAVPAAEAQLGEEEEVIGVQIGGHFRAYRIGAMTSPSRHIVNDMLSDVPVSVTYCNISECIRVFRGEQNGPLELMQIGIIQNRLVLKAGEGTYYQDTQEAVSPEAAPFPFKSVNAERTTWGAWKKAHPLTDVFLGGAPPPEGKTGHAGVEQGK